MLKAATLREMTRAELVQKKLELEEEVFNLNMRRSIKQLDNPLRLREVGREIGKVMTILREDELKIRTLAVVKTSVLVDTTRKKDSNK